MDEIQYCPVTTIAENWDKRNPTGVRGVQLRWGAYDNVPTLCVASQRKGIGHVAVSWSLGEYGIEPAANMAARELVEFLALGQGRDQEWINFMVKQTAQTIIENLSEDKDLVKCVQMSTPKGKEYESGKWKNRRGGTSAPAKESDRPADERKVRGF